MDRFPFLDRQDELGRLDRLARSKGGGLAVLHGRRRLGKTRLLLEWCQRHEGLYLTADLSSPEVQRRIVAGAVASRFPGFADAEYPDWAALLARLARDARQADWRGPLVIDELPYLVQSSPELPSVLQRWIDHEAKAARLVVAVAGSSQRMMQGIVLDAGAPLFGRAAVSLEIGPLPAAFLAKAFANATAVELIEHYAAWGTVARYWELAADASGTVRSRIDELLLDPLGTLHREPDRLLLEELPPAAEVRPVLDAIGAGAHRLSEIAGRAGSPATSLSRPLRRLLEMGLLRRETPFGEPELKSKISLYKISDPCLRLWFRVVAPHQAVLEGASRQGRLAVLDRYWDNLRAQAFEEMCRAQWPRCAHRVKVGGTANFGAATRWWHGKAPEWDLVSASLDDSVVVLGLAHFSEKPLDQARINRLAADLESRPAPNLPKRYHRARLARVLMVPALAPGVRAAKEFALVTASDLLAA